MEKPSGSEVNYNIIIQVLQNQLLSITINYYQLPSIIINL